MITTDLTLRRADAADTEAILRLWRDSLGEGKIPRNQTYWSWKHLNNPFGPSPCLLAEADGELVGLRVFMRWSWQAGERRLRAVRAVDTVTHPQWRGRKIFSRLTLALLEQMAAEGVSFVFNTPNALSKPGYLKMGWSDLGRTTLWIRLVRPLRVAGAVLSGGVTRHGSKDDVSPLSGRFSRVDELLRAPGLEDFLRAMEPPEERLWTPRDGAYLRWRYQEIPGFDYYAACQLDGENGAVIIFRSERQGELQGLRICELLLGPGPSSRRIGRSLLASVLREAGAEFAVAMAAAQTPEQRILLSSAFVPVPRLGPHFTVRPLNGAQAAPDPLRWRDWRLAIGDVEMF